MKKQIRGPNPRRETFVDMMDHFTATISMKRDANGVFVSAELADRSNAADIRPNLPINDTPYYRTLFSDAPFRARRYYGDRSSEFSVGGELDVYDIPMGTTPRQGARPADRKTSVDVGANKPTFDAAWLEQITQELRAAKPPAQSAADRIGTTAIFCSVAPDAGDARNARTIYEAIRDLEGKGTGPIKGSVVSTTDDNQPDPSSRKMG